MIISLASGFIAGIALGSFVSLNIWIFVALLFLSVFVFLYKFFAEEKDVYVYVQVSVFILCVLLGCFRIYFSPLNQTSQLEKFVGQNIELIGVVDKEPDVRENNTKLTIKVNKVIEVEAKSSPEDLIARSDKVGFRENILLTLPIYPEYLYGDKLKIKTILVSPKNIESDDGRIFDYEDYLKVRGIWYVSKNSFPKVELLSSGNGNTIKTVLFKIKKSFTGSINNVLPEPESSLLSGLLLGAKQSLGKDMLDKFQRSGVSHIVVLSGYNIAIVAQSIIDFLSFLPKNFSFGAGALGIILFTILSGGGASAVRASIMVLVALFAKRFERDYKAGRALGFVVVLMLAQNPSLLVFDPSFQLSVMATIGLVFVSPIILPFFCRVPEKFLGGVNLREIISTTVATQTVVLPFLIYSNGLLSLSSLPVNILVLGTIPLTMLFGFMTGVVGLISFYLSFIPAVFTYILLKYQLIIINLGSIVPFGSVKLPSFSPLFLVVVYLIIFYVLYKIKNREKIILRS